MGSFIKTNEEEAVIFFNKAAKQYEADGMLWYGICLIEGRGTRKNFYLGRDFIERSLEKHFFLAVLYHPTIEERRRRFT